MQRLLRCFLVLLYVARLAAAPALAQMSSDDRVRLSDEMLGQISRIHSNTPAPPSEKLVEDVFTELASYAERRHIINYRVSVIESNDINAYAMPDGRVVVLSGLLRALPSDAGDRRQALAFVLAHEISHVERSHAESKYMQAVGAATAINVLKVILKVPSNDLSKLVAGVAFGMVTSGYSREMETDADHNGYQMLKAAHFDPNGGLHIFALFRQMGQHSGIRFFPTHPDPNDRYKNLIGWMKGDGIVIHEPSTESRYATSGKGRPQVSAAPRGSSGGFSDGGSSTGYVPPRSEEPGWQSLPIHGSGWIRIPPGRTARLSIRNKGAWPHALRVSRLGRDVVYSTQFLHGDGSDSTSLSNTSSEPEKYFIEVFVQRPGQTWQPITDLRYGNGYFRYDDGADHDYEDIVITY